MDTDEFAAVYLKHKPSVIRFIKGCYPTVDQELLHDFYAEAWEIVSKQRSIRLKTFKTYLVCIMKNKVKDHFRSLKRSDDMLDRAGLSLQDPETLELCDKLNQVHQPNDTKYEQVMSSLPPSLRLVAELHFIDGLSQKDIAKKLSVSERWVWGLANKAKTRIIKMYKHSDVVK